MCVRPTGWWLFTGHPALRDRIVRLAMAHATDKQKLIDQILLGLGNPGLTLIPDWLGVWYNDSLTDYAFDVAAANKILDDARFRAFEAKTGKELWTVRLPGAAEATPMTYEGRDGKQYVVITATGGGFFNNPVTSDAIIAYRLERRHAGSGGAMAGRV